MSHLWPAVWRDKLNTSGFGKMILLGKSPNQGAMASYEDGTASCPEFYAIKRRVNGTILSSTDFDNAKPGFFEKLLGRSTTLKAALYALRRKADYEHIYTTGEELGVALLLGLKFSNWKGKVHMVVHACNSAKRRAMFRFLGDRHVGSYICVSSTQANILTEKVGLPADKVHFWYNWVDTNFYDPRKADVSKTQGYIFSCGLENRDYATLQAASASLPYSFLVQASGFFSAQPGEHDTEGNNFTVNRTKVPFEELRSLYAGARFVVVPLNAVEYAAGVTGILEAMSMGKALVVTDSPGIRDYFVHEESALVVPPNDPTALAKAIAKLWEDDELRDRMGARNRQWCIDNAAVEDYATKVGEQMR